MPKEGKVEIRDAAPTSIHQIVGQRNVIDQLSVALDAAFADGQSMPHSMLVGPPGVGKTLVAKVIAKEMESDLHEVLGQTLTGPAELNALLLQANDCDVVFIDEAHEIPKTLQTAMYLALDQQKVLLANNSGKVPSGIPLAKFTLLLASTDEYGLLQPLRDRMKLLLRFGFYHIDELGELLRRTSRHLGWEVDEKILPLIAQRSRGIPRLALRLLQTCRRVCRAKGDSKITITHLERACALEQIDSLGLGPNEQHYLKTVAEGASRLNVISSTLGLPASTVSNVIEPFLIRTGLIIKDEQSRRQLTSKGRIHLQQSEQQKGKANL